LVPDGSLRYTSRTAIGLNSLDLSGVQFRLDPLDGLGANAVLDGYPAHALVTLGERSADGGFFIRVDLGTTERVACPALASTRQPSHHAVADKGMVAATPKRNRRCHCWLMKLTPAYGHQLIRLFHVEPPDRFCNGRVNIRCLDGAEPFFGWSRTHNVDVPLGIGGHGADT
jgi:hypothetical protein